MLKTGYYADSDTEAQAWMEELRSIGEARKKRKPNFKGASKKKKQSGNRSNVHHSNNNPRPTMCSNHAKQYRFANPLDLNNQPPPSKTVMASRLLNNAPFRILQWNCRGLATRKAELLTRLAQASIYVRRGVSHIKIDTMNWCTTTQEVVAVRVALDGTTKRLLIVSTYVRPLHAAYDVDMNTPTPDTHLLSLWDRRTAALTKYRRHKRRCYLKRLTPLTKEASTYAQTLNLTRWIAHCESFDRTTKLGEVSRTFNAMYGKRKSCSPTPRKISWISLAQHSSRNLTISYPPMYIDPWVK
ncbi:hypothetical protein HPB47_008973 [Ixodes persulcatus]|uniref:Uncharacterized protein n=1 Tax=Ixodes persulcatus TaxID=34615 RepID=A0AC60P391_IXOPE|nr:hypothetical protein HPB47_008973 [Ixodes persulcatus]